MTLFVDGDMLRGIRERLARGESYCSRCRRVHHWRALCLPLGESCRQQPHSGTGGLCAGFGRGGLGPACGCPL